MRTSTNCSKSLIRYGSDMDFKDFIKIYNKCTVEPYSFLVNDTTLSSDNLLRFKKIFSNKYIIKS